MAEIVYTKEDIAGVEIAAMVGCVDQRFVGNEQFKAALLNATGVVKVYPHQVAGPNWKLAYGNDAKLESIKDEVEEIGDLTGTRVVFATGHGNCARHGVSDEEHRRDILKGAKRLAEQLDDSWKILPVFIPITGQDEAGVDLWGVEIVTPEAVQMAA